MLPRVVKRIVPKNVWQMPQRHVSTFNDEEVESNEDIAKAFKKIEKKADRKIGKVVDKIDTVIQDLVKSMQTT